MGHIPLLVSMVECFGITGLSQHTAIQTKTGIGKLCGDFLRGARVGEGLECQATWLRQGQLGVSYWKVTLTSNLHGVV